MPIHQSFCSPLFMAEGISLDDLFAKAKSLGYAATEMWFRDGDFAQWADTVHKHKLRIASICGHDTLGVGMNDPAEHDRIEGEIRESIDVAVQYDIAGLITFAGNRRDGLTDDEALDISATLLRRVAPYAEEKGVNLNMELLNSKVDHAGYQGDHTAWGVALCEAVGSPRVKLLYDIYHMQIMEGDVIRTIRDSINWIGHFHTAGNPGRNDMDDTQELCYPAICKAIAETDYDLYLGHEFTAKGDRLEALAAAYDTCSVD
ncbi:MAG TPA: TIM barrel protein [Candidatus Latescibacteria bacterium]|nr:TIM barrel protein [Candidatus Latescibacterota bacterium]